jgi:hypothetical protein
VRASRHGHPRKVEFKNQKLPHSSNSIAGVAITSGPCQSIPPLHSLGYPFMSLVADIKEVESEENFLFLFSFSINRC